MSLDEEVRYLRIGKYKDNEGVGDLYYDVFEDTFYREKDYKYLVEIPESKMPVNLLLHKLYFFEKNTYKRLKNGVEK